MPHNPREKLRRNKDMIDDINKSNSWTSVRGDILDFKPERVNELAKASEDNAYEHYREMCQACGFYAVKGLCTFAYHDSVRFEGSETNLVKKLNEGIPGTKQDYKGRMKGRVVEGSYKTGRHLILRNGEIACRGLVDLPRIGEKERNYYHQKLQEIEAPFAAADNQDEPEPEQIELDI